jgi:hypothetical protein
MNLLVAINADALEDGDFIAPVRRLAYGRRHYAAGGNAAEH